MSSSSGQRAAVDVLTAKVHQRFGDAALAVAFYGSALRDDQPVDDGLFDLLVVVDSYRHAYGTWPLATLNLLLPPNVFYLEAELDDVRIRAKYAVVSLPQLRRHVAPRCLQTYFWGRLAQPVELVHARDDDARDAIESVLRQASVTLAGATAPRLPGTFDTAMLWSRGLALSYSTEFRPERKERAGMITASGHTQYERAARDAAQALGWRIEESAEGTRFVTSYGRARRAASWFAWLARRVQGRVLHVLRLVKATWTFDGGIDYLVWKIERHSGVKVEVSARARRHPLLLGWWTLWRLRRKGGFR